MKNETYGSEELSAFLVLMRKATVYSTIFNTVYKFDTWLWDYLTHRPSFINILATKTERAIPVTFTQVSLIFFFVLKAATNY